MKITALIYKVSKDLIPRTNLKTKPQKIPSFISQNQAWRRGYATTIAEIVKVTSREMIKPSSPTPNHNKTVHFSLIDQIVPSVYNSIVLFYQNDPNNNNNHLFNTMEKRSKLLKESLSEILVDFYPLAGRSQRNELMECNDEGVEFVEANLTNENLIQFIENPSHEHLQALLPFQGTPRHTNIVLSVQVNHFSCGGMALGVCLSHKITDGAALVDFLKAWSTKTQHSDHVVSPPNFNGASLFPPLTEFNDTILSPPINEKGIAIRRLIFEKKMIDGLKVKTCAIDSTIIRPTTIEVVTAFIWKHLPKFSVLHFVNLRTKMVPNIPINSFGNFAWFTRTSSPCCDNEHHEYIINELRKTIKKIDNDYIQDLLFRDESMMKLKKEIYEVYGMSGNCLFFSSLSGFPVYEVNFGMGKPIWACLPSTFDKNFILVMKTQCGQGIEVWICMLEDDIAMLDDSISQLGYPLAKQVRMN